MYQTPLPIRLATFPLALVFRSVLPNLDPFAVPSMVQPLSFVHRPAGKLYWVPFYQAGLIAAFALVPGKGTDLFLYLQQEFVSTLRQAINVFAVHGDLCFLVDFIRFPVVGVEVVGHPHLGFQLRRLVLHFLEFGFLGLCRTALPHIC